MDSDPQKFPSSTVSLPDKGHVTLEQVQVSVAEIEEPSASRDPTLTKKGFSFWMVFLAISLSLFLYALEATAISTALPTILADINGGEFVWISSAYSLASTCLIPASGGLAEILGRRPVMLFSIVLYALGSALCGSAKNMTWLISGRAIQGAGGGAIFSLSAIVIGDLVPLKERGIFQGASSLVWTVASGIGPIIGGALAKHGNWRWLFYLNLPISGVAFGLVLFFLKLRSPSGTLREKMARVDWIGNILITGSSAACVIALSWAGAQFSWSSAHVLVPLIVGLVGIGVFLFYEHTFAKNPIVPFNLLTNRTSLSGYIQTFIVPTVAYALTYFLPAYFQACFGVSPLRSGVLALSLSAVLGPSLIIAGVSVTITKRYRPQLWAGWVLVIVGMGVVSILDADSPVSQQVGLPIVMDDIRHHFPILAPLPVTQNAHALALFSFLRSFATVWGISVGTVVLQNELNKRLPKAFLDELPDGVTSIYSAIPAITALPESLRVPVRVAFAQSVDRVFQVMAGIAGIGLIASFFMEGLPLHTQVDNKWGLENKKEEVVDLKELMTHAPRVDTSNT